MDRKIARELIGRLREDADRICERFGLRYAALEAERANVKRRYGICYADGTIKIRLRHVASGRPLKYSSLVNTLCHELAHLRHFNHGPQFRAFYKELLEWARAEGIYIPRAPRTAVPQPSHRKHRPTPEDHDRAPSQLSLF
jgi:predicted metal-dependent hydrolase